MALASDPSMVSRLQGSSLTRDSSLDAFLSAVKVEQSVKERFAAIDKGRLLKTVMLVLPVLTTIVGVVGGLFTVYASTDCKDSRFEKYSRMFLYTSLTYTITNIVMDKSIGTAMFQLLKHPRIAFPVYCLQALTIGAFFVVMVVLLALIIRTACPGVRSRVLARLRL